jgi:hypothetical protein
MKKGKAKRPRGRPLTYRKAVADRILTRLAAGDSLRSICEDAGMPSKGAVLGWVVHDVDGFADRYAHARTAQAWEYHDDIVEIADQSGADVSIDPETGSISVNGEVVQRAKLRVDTRKWLMSKLLPMRFGEKQSIEHSGPDGTPLEVTVTRRVVKPE